ncbi:hypothetical protein ACRAWF_22915 [Streptomyces sp. L7]
MGYHIHIPTSKKRRQTFREKTLQILQKILVLSAKQMLSLQQRFTEVGSSPLTPYTECKRSKRSPAAEKKNGTATKLSLLTKFF